MSRNRKCPLCGREIKRPDGYLTQFQGKSAHCSCVQQWVTSRLKTAKLLGVSDEEAKNWIKF